MAKPRSTVDSVTKAPGAYKLLCLLSRPLVIIAALTLVFLILFLFSVLAHGSFSSVIVAAKEQAGVQVSIGAGDSDA